MSRPPSAYRRRKRRRRIALGVLALALPLTLGGFAYWQDTRFPAHSEWVRGLPVELRVQDGVSGRELHAIRVGLRDTAGFMRTVLGRTVEGRVEVRVARSNGCRPFQAAGEAIVGEAQAGFLCVDTASPAWKWLMMKDRLAATASAGHEYVHVLQDELGCLRSPRGEHFRWLVEGMAEEISWRALAAAGLTSGRRAMREIVDSGAFDPNLEPLRSYETDGGRDPEYALWHLAVRRLVAYARAAGATPAGRPEFALRRFCDRVAAARPWRRAFRQSFRISTDRFYARFEAERRVDAMRFDRGG
jgi:hypothetical protein